ncbi:MAG: hypothetical protein RL065_1810 [Bacteroidota bacterium]
MKKKLILFIILFYSLISKAQTFEQSLNSDKVKWRFYCADKNFKIPAEVSVLTNRNGNVRGDTNLSNGFPAKVPGTIHLDLLDNKLIPDPFYADNEKKLQWIDTLDWVYETTFDVDSNLFKLHNIELQFDGLDTYADVYLNDEKIITADNMFVKWNEQVKDNLKLKNNLLKIYFHSTLKEAKKLKAQFEKAHGYELPEGERVFVRKAQYQFGWDFAPRFLGCGIWKSIKIIGRTPIYESKINFASSKKVTINLFKKGETTFEFIQQKDSIGESFYFKLNEKPVFIKGANWVPADVFLPRVSHEKYRTLLTAAKDEGINMLRVWGGGIYEDDFFYNLCDSLNIMVWQDLPFTCAMYPVDKNFISNFKIELIQNVQRLQNHPCVVLFCGNNEINEGWKNWGWQQQYHYSKKDSAEIWNSYEKLFEEIIPNTLKEMGCDIPYIPSSPKFGWGHKESLTDGDSHYWGVWWGMEPYEIYKKRVPRFASEYGMQSLPCLSTIKKFAPDSSLRINSVAMRNHQKHPTGFENLDGYLKYYHFNVYGGEVKGRKVIPEYGKGNPDEVDSTKKIVRPNPTEKEFEDYINATQQLQADALRTAIEAHLKAQPRCMGTILWQLNEPWPGASWSLIDYYGNKKKAYYEVQKLFKEKK